MITTEPEASTLDEYRQGSLSKIEHRGYYYYPYQKNPQKATQFSGIFWANINPEDYMYIINDQMGAPLDFAIPYFNPNASMPFPIESYYAKANLRALNRPIIMIGPLSKKDAEASRLFPTDTIQTIWVKNKVERIVFNLFKSYGHEEFDSDISYYFTNDLEKLIIEHGKPSIEVIGNIISRETLNQYFISEILRALGRIEDTNTKNLRFDLLISYLKNVSSIIRDAAVSGLSFLDNKRALPQLRMLFETETITILKSNIKVAIKSLET